jgi:DNA-binding CsgD family transcriptional regulator
LRETAIGRSLFVMTLVEEAVVGRGRELELVERFLTSDLERAKALAIKGPPGIGKTTVWQAGLRLAHTAGRRLLVARPTGAEASLSFAGLVDLLTPVEDALLSGLPSPQRRALAAALLRGDAPGGRVDRRAVGTATAAVLAKLAAEQPTLVAVDDAQWLDKATADALAFALRRLLESDLAVLCSARTGDELHETFETALPDNRRSELELSPLSLAAMHDLIEARLGHSLPRPTLVRIRVASGGNAFYALELAREHVRGGGDAEMHVPRTVQELVRSRVARLPRRTRDALLLAAASSAPTTAVVGAEDLTRAEEAGVVRVDGDGHVHFEHPLVAAAIYESAPVGRRQEAHRQLMELAREPEVRARHLALATENPDASVAAELDAAAAHTAARGAATAAAELARLALAATPPDDDESYARRALALSHHLLDGGETATARAVLGEECDRRAVAGDLLAELLRAHGYVLWYEGDRERGYELVLEALEHARDRELAGRIHYAAAWLLHEQDLSRGIEHADAAVGILDPDQHPGPYSLALLLGVYMRLLSGEGSDEEAYERGRKLQERATDWDDTSPVLGMWSMLHDRFAEAHAWYQWGLERSLAEGDATSVQGTLVRLTEIACWTGDWETADRLAAEGLELADRIGSPAFLGSALFARGLIDAHLGRVDEACDSGQRIVDLLASSLQRSLGWWVLGFTALSTGDAALADEHYSRAQEIVDSLGQREPARFRFQPDHLEAVIELGDLERARALLEALELRAEVFPRPWLLATSARCRALLLAAEGDLSAARTAAEAALTHHERLEMPFERARTLLVAGRILRRLKQKRDARTLLAEATHEFERLGAATWQRRAEAELRRTTTRRAPDGLTPTEKRIAELAASGLANPEIAARVFVSRKTVEANLKRVYRKLGIASRAQLARALDAQHSKSAS